MNNDGKLVELTFDLGLKTFFFFENSENYAHFQLDRAYDGEEACRLLSLSSQFLFDLKSWFSPKFRIKIVSSDFNFKL